MVEPWNNLPETVMQSKTLNTFKNRLDQFWSNQAILYEMQAQITLNIGTRTREIIADIVYEDLIIEDENVSCNQTVIRHHKGRNVQTVNNNCCRCASKRTYFQIQRSRRTNIR